MHNSLHEGTGAAAVFGYFRISAADCIVAQVSELGCLGGRAHPARVNLFPLTLTALLLLGSKDAYVMRLHAGCPVQVSDHCSCSRVLEHKASFDT